ncbi:MAG: YbhB/YbcL family Raf kinase inhibitor-like protein [Planctomycetota bacterium]
MDSLRLSSPAFDEGGFIPVTYTGDGKNLSPPLMWTEPPAGTVSFALVCEDPDAPGGIWAHWVVSNLPPDCRELLEGMIPEEPVATTGVQGKNDFGTCRYSGPEPPHGRLHHYYFRLFALNTVLPLLAGSTRDQLLQSIRGHVLSEARLMGRYQR